MMCSKLLRDQLQAAGQVPLLCTLILVVSSKPLQIAQREFGMRFMCVYWALNNGPGVASVAGKQIRATIYMAMVMVRFVCPNLAYNVNPHMAMAGKQ